MNIGAVKLDINLQGVSEEEAIKANDIHDMEEQPLFGAFYVSDKLVCDCERNYDKNCKNPNDYKTNGCK